MVRGDSLGGRGSSLLGSCLLFGSGSSLLRGCCLLGGNGASSSSSELSNSGGGCFGFLAFFGGGIGEFPELSDSGAFELCAFLAFFFGGGEGGGESAEASLGGGFFGFGLELEASS